MKSKIKRNKFLMSFFENTNKSEIEVNGYWLHKRGKHIGIYKKEFLKKKLEEKKGKIAFGILKLFIDGGCSNNGQKDMKKRKMVSVVADERNNILIEEKSRGGSNNIAEFIALYEAIKYCVENKIENVEIITDSRNNLSWFYKQLKKRKQNDFEWILSIRNQIDLIRKQVNITLTWRPREENLAGIYIENKFKL